MGLMKKGIKSKSKLMNRFKSWCATVCHKKADTDPKKETDTTFVSLQMFCYRSTPEIFQGQTQLDQCQNWNVSIPDRKTFTGRTCIFFQQRYYRKTDRESGREEMRRKDDRRGGGR